MHQESKEDKKEKNKARFIDSSISTKEDKKSLERSRADLDIPDPKPEHIEHITAILQGDK